MKFFSLLVALLALSLALQEFVPVFDWAFSSRLLLAHTVFYACAVAVPFPAMLGLAAFTGFAWDARHYLPMHPPESQAGGFLHPELPFGFTIFVLGITGALLQGVRPYFRKGRWELPVLMIGLCTGLGLLLEYLAITFHRSGFLFPPELWWKLLLTSLFSALVSPLLLLLLSHLAERTRFRIRLDGPRRRHSYDGDRY